VIWQITSVDIETDASGNAEVYLGSSIRGLVYALMYDPGSLLTGSDLTITTETNEFDVLSVTNAGTSKVAYYPRAKSNEIADASEASSGSEMVPIISERVKVAVAQGGANKNGSIKLIYLTGSPF
tara:strand:- start:649 stop:1023 length:375 start_codon:yes stop_codon:yes gene_type:complete